MLFSIMKSLTRRYKLCNNFIMDFIEESKKRLLLHSCCGPCSTVVIERLMPLYDVTLFFYNPNIYPFEEYEKRKNEQKKVCENLGIGFVEGKYNDEEYYTFVNGLENEREGGARCTKCFEFRLKETAQFAKENNFDLFTTTLSVSPHKNSLIINQVGSDISQKLNIYFLQESFKKKDGYKRSIELSKEFDLYRQNYCGCKYSLR